jgi:hypothetical protein
MTRTIRQPGAQPGEYQRPRPASWPFRRVQLPTGADAPTYHWDRDGVLFHDVELTRPAGLVVVAYSEADDVD